MPWTRFATGTAPCAPARPPHDNDCAFERQSQALDKALDCGRVADAGGATAARGRPVLLFPERRRPTDDAIHLWHPGADVERVGRLRRTAVRRPASVFRP